MFEVEVGDESAVWSLHESILVASSSFFKAVIHSPFKEGNERKIWLADDDHLVFQLFVQYLYSRTFQTSSMTLLLKAYVLGDKLGAPAFRAHALDQIFGLSSESCRFTAEQVLWIFRNTLPGCGLRRLAADTAAHSTLRHILKYGNDDWGLLAPIMPEVMEGVLFFAGEQASNEQWNRKCRLAYQD